MKLSTVQLDSLLQAMTTIRGSLQQTPDAVMLTPGTITFYRADTEIGFIEAASGKGWVQRATGGSEAIGGTQ